MSQTAAQSCYHGAATRAHHLVRRMPCKSEMHRKVCSDGRVSPHLLRAFASVAQRKLVMITKSATVEISEMRLQRVHSSSTACSATYYACCCIHSPAQSGSGAGSIGGLSDPGRGGGRARSTRTVQHCARQEDAAGLHRVAPEEEVLHLRRRGTPSELCSAAACAALPGHIRSAGTALEATQRVHDQVKEATSAEEQLSS